MKFLPSAASASSIRWSFFKCSCSPLSCWTSPHSLLCIWRRSSRFLPNYRPLPLTNLGFALVRWPHPRGLPPTRTTFGGRWRNSLVFPRMPVSPPVVTSLGELIVANNDVLHFSAFRFNELRSRLVHYRYKKASVNPRDCQCSLHCSPAPVTRPSRTASRMCPASSPSSPPSFSKSFQSSFNGATGRTTHAGVQPKRYRPRRRFPPMIQVSMKD